jgi:hypothetical protein
MDGSLETEGYADWRRLPMRHRCSSLWVQRPPISPMGATIPPHLGRLQPFRLPPWTISSTMSGAVQVSGRRPAKV